MNGLDDWFDLDELENSKKNPLEDDESSNHYLEEDIDEFQDSNRD